MKFVVPAVTNGGSNEDIAGMVKRREIQSQIWRSECMRRARPRLNWAGLTKSFVRPRSQHRTPPVSERDVRWLMAIPLSTPSSAAFTQILVVSQRSGSDEYLGPEDPKVDVNLNGAFATS